MSIPTPTGNVFPTLSGEPRSEVFERPFGNAWGVLGVACALWSTAVIFVCMRVYSRRYLTNFWGNDDWLILASIVFSTTDFTLKMIWCFSGLGRTESDVTGLTRSRFAKVSYSLAIIYPWSLGITKISILTFYRRIFPHQSFRRFCLFLEFFIAAMVISVSVAQATVCMPVSQSWALHPVHPYQCSAKANLQYVASALNLSTDTLILLMPLKHLWELSLNKRKRLMIIALFSTGMLTCVASGIRFKTIYEFYNGTDPTADAPPIAMCGSVETNLAIITASVAASKPLIDKFVTDPLRRKWPSIFGSFHDYENSDGYGHKSEFSHFHSTKATTSCLNEPVGSEFAGFNLQGGSPTLNITSSRKESVATSTASLSVQRHTYFGDAATTSSVIGGGDPTAVAPDERDENDMDDMARKPSNSSTIDMDFHDYLRSSNATTPSGRSRPLLTRGLSYQSAQSSERRSSVTWAGVVPPSAYMNAPPTNSRRASVSIYARKMSLGSVLKDSRIQLDEEPAVTPEEEEEEDAVMPSAAAAVKKKPFGLGVWPSNPRPR